MYTDGHAHLDHILPEGERTMRDLGPVVADATRAGVTAIIQSGMDVGTSLWAVSAAAAFPTVWATVGFHPHEARRAEEDALCAIAALTAHPRVVGVGEIGLDFFYEHSPRDVQREIFVWMLELAGDADLPAVIHSRDAEDETLALLAEHAAGLTVVLHCFSMPDRMPELAERGYYLSFAGNVTFKNAEALRRAVREVPLDRLLLETDAPYLAPEPRRGRPNSPDQVVRTYQFVAHERGMEVEDLALHVRANLTRAYPRLADSVTCLGVGRP